VGSFDSLRYRNYRLMWTGAILSNVGTWMQAIALSWYVFELTHSPFWVSFVTFANFVPTILSPLGGVYVDRFDRRRILLITQSLMMVDAAVLAVLAWAGHAGLTVVMVLTFGQGLAFAFNGPAWQAFVPSLVPPEALVNAIALNSAQFSLARVIGPAVAGVLIGVTGPGLVFGINAISFVTVLIALVMIRLGPFIPGPRRSVRESLLGGLRYVWSKSRIKSMVAAIGVSSFFVAPVTALLPIYAADVYHHGAGGFGSLAASLGLGSVVGALVLGRMGNRIGPSVVAAALLALSTVSVLFAAIHSYVAGLGLMFLYGAGYLLVVSGTNSDIQLHVEEGMRGRVISIWVLAFGLLYPIGTLVAGTVADSFGAPRTTIVGAVVGGLWAVGMLVRYRGPAAHALPQPGS
jgi:MFS family permease